MPPTPTTSSMTVPRASSSPHPVLSGGAWHQAGRLCPALLPLISTLRGTAPQPGGVCGQSVPGHGGRGCPSQATSAFPCPVAPPLTEKEQGGSWFGLCFNQTLEEETSPSRQWEAPGVSRMLTWHPRASLMGKTWTPAGQPGLHVAAAMTPAARRPLWASVK